MMSAWSCNKKIAKLDSAVVCGLAQVPACYSPTAHRTAISLQVSSQAPSVDIVSDVANASVANTMTNRHANHAVVKSRRWRDGVSRSR